MFLQLPHLDGRRRVIHAQDLDKVRDGQHADELLLLRVPERGGADAIVHQRKERLLHDQLRVEHDKLGGRRDQVVALVELEELDVDLALVLLCKGKARDTISKLRVTSCELQVLGDKFWGTSFGGQVLGDKFDGTSFMGQVLWDMFWVASLMGQAMNHKVREISRPSGYKMHTLGLRNWFNLFSFLC